MDNRIFTYLRNNAVVCFDTKILGKNEMGKKLSSSKPGDIVECIAVCGTLIRESLFDAEKKLPKVLNLISNEDIQNAMEMTLTVNVFSNLKKSNRMDTIYCKYLRYGSTQFSSRTIGAN